jgi:hypothetical protein
LAIFFWHNATVQRNAATLQRTIAVSRQLAAESQTNLTGDPQLALILALRAYDSNPTEGRCPRFEKPCASPPFGR